MRATEVKDTAAGVLITTELLDDGDGEELNRADEESTNAAGAEGAASVVEQLCGLLLADAEARDFALAARVHSMAAPMWLVCKAASASFAAVRFMCVWGMGAKMESRRRHQHSTNQKCWARQAIESMKVKWRNG